MSNSAVNAYIRQVSKKIPGGGAAKKEMLNQLRELAEEYALAHPDCTGKDLCAEFGDPEQCAAAYSATLSEGELAKQLQKRRAFRRWLIGVGIAVVFAVAGIFAFLIVWNSNNSVTEIRYDAPVFSAQDQEGRIK